MVLIKALRVNNRVPISPASASIFATIERPAISPHVTESGPTGFGDDQGPCRLRIIRITEGKGAVVPGCAVGAVDQVVPGSKSTVVHFNQL